MKTKIVELLNQPPVKRYKRRSVVHSPVLTVEEESRIDLQYEELYRFEARIGATFWLEDTAGALGREHSYEQLKRHVTEKIYGEVRSEVLSLMPLIADMPPEPRREASHIINNIMEMTQP